MKSIIVKTENGVKAYMSPISNTQYNTETGESKKIELTDEEAEQHCYQSLISDVKRQQFDKQLIFLLNDYFGDIDNWTNIQVKLSFSNSRRAELNVGNPNNIQWQKMEVPEIKEQ